MQTDENLAELWLRLPFSNSCSSLEEMKYRRKKIRELEGDIRYHLEFLREAQKEVETAITEHWTAMEIAVALAGGDEEEAVRHLKAAKRKQRSWRSSKHGLISVSEILKKSVFNGRENK